MEILYVIFITVLFITVFGLINYAGIIEYRGIKSFEGSRPINKVRLVYIKLLLTFFDLFGICAWWYMVKDFFN